ncbi:HU family DNA-binding protein [Pontivivens ytuae]|uniref:HU family DNA-binding protein n=1 Tax=Pontivivens ytuae TaxID=2789856 RepID=A0A7S9QE19_9RHOB|nr:HU family DNA-binding protein [Pontivivens ytuae]QPH54756.1 HU family DNA-binding protein [Pontivivens ytuae]
MIDTPDDAPDTPETDDTPPMLRKRELVERVAELTGRNKAEVRATLDTAFAEMRTALLDGRDVQYPALGRIRIKTPNRPDAQKIYRLMPAKSAAVDPTENGLEGPAAAE